jgi:hypothetical protein
MERVLINFEKYMFWRSGAWYQLFEKGLYVSLLGKISEEKRMFYYSYIEVDNHITKRKI